MAISTKNERMMVTVPKELKAQLKELAQRDHRDLSTYARLVLANHVASQATSNTQSDASDSSNQ